MTDQEVLRKALNEIDGYRYRWGWSFGITAALSQVAWIVATIVARNPNTTEKQLIAAATIALAMTVFGGVFLLVLLIYRMTHKLLTAIEIAARRD